MKKIYLLLAIILFATISFAQDAKKDDWIRVQSDDGEFSIEVPAKYGYFYDKTGFWVRDSRQDQHQLEEMKMMTAYYESSLIGIESYKSIDKAIDEVIETEKLNGKSAEIKKDGIKINQIVRDFSGWKDANKYYLVRWFLRFNKTTYILTAGSRNGETNAIKHFFESIIIKIDKLNPLITNAQKFSTLKPTPIEYVDKPEKIKENKEQKADKIGEKQAGEEYLAILQRPFVYPVSSAYIGYPYPRGTIRLKLTLSEEGRVTKIEVLNKVHHGLLRQTVFAAIRMKFIPPEKDGKPISTNIIYEKTFSNY